MCDKEIRLEDLPEKLVTKMEGYTPDKAFASNGCSYAPDEIGGADLRPACHFHDWAYHIGGGKKGRKDADHALFRNLMECGVSRFIANKYYYRVRLWGGSAFNWSGKKPGGFKHFMWLLLGRYWLW